MVHVSDPPHGSGSLFFFSGLSVTHVQSEVLTAFVEIAVPPRLDVGSVGSKRWAVRAVLIKKRWLAAFNKSTETFLLWAKGGKPE